MPEKDYYKILGLEKSASGDEIKKSYRKLAMKYHPDHAKGDKRAEEKFKKISEAYAVLSNKDKRKQYDEFGARGFNQRYTEDDILKNFDFSNIFKEFGFGGGNYCRRGGARHSSVNNFFFGSSPERQTVQKKGNDIVYELPLTLHDVLSGTSKTVNLQNNGRMEKIKVKIPKGMITGKKIRLPGKGKPGSYGGPAGDLFIQSKVINDPFFEVKDVNVYINENIKITDALLGVKIPIPTLDNKTLNVNILPGTSHKTMMRLSGLGLPQMNSDARGDLFVKIYVEMPSKLTSEQKKIIKKLARTGI